MSKTKVLHPIFFDRPTLVVAPDLLGKFLVVKNSKKIQALMITEVEAYDGVKDQASHAFRGKTGRNFPMFGPAGVWYVYFTYGIHWMLNIVTGPENYPSAILIRGVCDENDHYHGPAKLTKFLGIDKRFNDLPVTKKTGLWVEDRGVKISKKQVKKSARIGVGYAGPIWSKKHYRFYLDD